MIWLGLVTGGIYLFAIAIFFYGWEKLKKFTRVSVRNQATVSVIIAMRNEESNIVDLLHDLANQDYSQNLYEVIVVDDHSSDRSFQLASGFAAGNIKVYKLPGNVAGKKAALNYGITMSRGDYIMTTDADCRTGKSWIACFASYFEVFCPIMLLGPVISMNDSAEDLNRKKLSRLSDYLSLAVSKLQSLEMFSLLGTTAGACSIRQPVMSNGANLAFPKAIYPEIEDLYAKGNTPSGDDIFVMLRLKKKYPGEVHFLKSNEAVVSTYLPDKLSSFFSQRSRWAAKSKFYNDPAIIVTAMIVFSVNFLLLFSFIDGVLHRDFLVFSLLIFSKSFIDFLFLYRVTSFFGQKRLMFWFPLAQSLYFIYVCITVFLSLVLPNRWKGRQTWHPCLFVRYLPKLFFYL